MSEPTKKPSIYDGLKYIYAEQLKDKRVTMTIKRMEPAKFTDSRGGKSTGWDIYFEETDKPFGAVSATVIRQLYVATGTGDPVECVGKKIILYAVDSAKAAAGKAIRIAPVLAD